MKGGHYTKLVRGIIYPGALWKTTQKVCGRFCQN